MKVLMSAFHFYYCYVLHWKIYGSISNKITKTHSQQVLAKKSSNHFSKC